MFPIILSNMIFMIIIIMIEKIPKNTKISFHKNG